MALEFPSQKGAAYKKNYLSHLPSLHSKCRHLVKDFWDWTNLPEGQKYNSNGHYCYYDGYKVCKAKKNVLLYISSTTLFITIARAFLFLKFFSGDLCLQPKTSVQPEQQALQHSRHGKNE